MNKEVTVEFLEGLFYEFCLKDPKLAECYLERENLEKINRI